jgi:hypothetical protein
MSAGHSVLRLAVLLLAAAIAVWGQTPAVFSQMDEMLGALSDITGWKVERKVPAETLSKEKFREFVENNLKEAADSREIQAEETALKMFGLVPQDFNLLRETADLYTEQAAAFYDYRKKRLVLLDSTTNRAEQRMAVVHELAHALADQRYSIKRYMHRGASNDDATTARQAVTEGQATWLTFAYLARRSGGKAEVPLAMLDQLAGQTGAVGEDFPVLSNTPLYIRESLMFPYTEGLRFQDAVYRERGRAGFDEVFQRPPISTQHILHAPAYFAATRPATPELPKLREVAGQEARRLRKWIEGSLGEFDISALLRQYVGRREGAAAASRWRGGSFRLYEHKRAKYPVLVHAAQWETPQDARAYFNLYQRVLRGKWKTYEVASASENEVTGNGDSGRFVLRLRGDLVQSVEGLR